jgi:hypothetical protein
VFESCVNWLMVTTRGSKRIAMYRMIKKSACTWWLQYRKLQVMFKVPPASLQTFINCVLEDCVQYSTVHIPNVFCDGHLQLTNCVLYCSRQVNRDLWSSCTVLCIILSCVWLACVQLQELQVYGNRMEHYYSPVYNEYWSTMQTAVKLGLSQFCWI